MDALYFPNLSLPGPAWTNPIALYFDRIGIIAPSEYEAKLSDSRTSALIDAGIVLPLFAGGFQGYEADEEVLDGLADWWREQSLRLREPCDLYTIHRGKLTHTDLVKGLVQRKLLRRHPFEPNWLVGPQPVCIKVMTLLAGRILNAGAADAMVTDTPVAFELVAEGPIATDGGSGRRIRAVTKLLPAAPWISPEKLKIFKESHRAELRQFRGFVEQLIRRTSDEAGFEARLNGAEELREHLSGELSGIGARSNKSAMGLMLSKFAASAVESSLLSGAIDLVSGLRSHATDARRGREIRRDGLVYAALARSEFRARSSQEILA